MEIRRVSWPIFSGMNHDDVFFNNTSKNNSRKDLSVDAFAISIEIISQIMPKITMNVQLLHLDHKHF